MKKILLAVITTSVLLGCNDAKKQQLQQEKHLLEDVIAVHDKVMANDEHLMKNKMVLDSMVKNIPTPAIKDSATVYLKLVDSADDAMGDWMHKFDAENKNKSHEEIMNYLGDQKKKIIVIEAQIDIAVKESNKYLSQFKK
ncbi:hypothetical protein SAMN05216464_101287 [Mucilaginibacter pineti]|uniref:Viral A-type inclusion protein n=1 Tax=Mucilaginibacter pineti TaxID=1391627 RepID=A0A1G6TFY0_9SPHI|nr:hypothetical protein [Mucilaginibacter pineti]SDD28062.1 hypothetical protein SAMN05216464_101287 [Mucilaginibacter pineti]